MRIRDVALRTCQKRWTIGRSGERGSGISMLAEWHDDDDDLLFQTIYILYRVFLLVNTNRTICYIVKYIPTQQWRKMSADFFREIYLSLYCKGSKRVTQGMRVRRSWRPNRTAIFWPPLLWPSALCLSRSPELLNRRPRGPALCWMMAFFTTSYHQLVWSPNSIGGPEGPFGLVWLFLPHLVSNFNCNCLISVLTELYK